VIKRALLGALVLFPLPAFARPYCESCVSPPCRMMFCGENEGDSRPWYCRGPDPYSPCDRDGNIIRYHTPDSPYRREPIHHNRYGDDD
jgi:hypothetical protein